MSLLTFLAINLDLAFSGIIGSGLCVFSKHSIQEITQHIYTLNGYPYMVSLTSSTYPLHPPLTRGKEAAFLGLQGKGRKRGAVL